MDSSEIGDNVHRVNVCVRRTTVSVWIHPFNRQNIKYLRKKKKQNKKIIIIQSEWNLPLQEHWLNVASQPRQIETKTKQSNEIFSDNMTTTTAAATTITTIIIIMTMMLMSIDWLVWMGTSDKMCQNSCERNMILLFFLCCYLCSLSHVASFGILFFFFVHSLASNSQTKNFSYKTE